MATNHPRYSNIHTSFGEGATKVACVGDGALKVLTIFNTAVVDRFIMIFDRTTVPTAGTRPTLCFPVYAKNGYTELGSEVFTDEGHVFDLGLVWGLSTTPATYTPADPTDAILTLRWV